MSEHPHDTADTAPTEQRQIGHPELFSLSRTLRRWSFAAVGFGLAYTGVVATIASADVLWNWLHTLGATLVSVMLAFATGLMIYRRQRDHDSASERIDDLHVLKFLLLEYRHKLAANQQQEFALWDFKGRALIDHFDATIFENIARGGQHDPRFSLFLVQAANAARMYNLRVRYFLDLAATTSAARGAGSHLLTNAAADIEHARTNLWGLLDGLYNNVDAILRDPLFQLGDHIVLNRRVLRPGEHLPPSGAA